jgi:hypothetical protein
MYIRVHGWAPAECCTYHNFKQSSQKASSCLAHLWGNSNGRKKRKKQRFCMFVRNVMDDSLEIVSHSLIRKVGRCIYTPTFYYINFDIAYKRCRF